MLCARGVRTGVLISLALLGPSITAGQEMRTRIVDVGAGLCAVTAIPGGHYFVYDAGHWNGRRCIEAVREIVEGEVIDLMIISHSDSDHLGDADDILREYDVRHIVWTGHRKPGTTNWENMNDAIAEEVRNSAATVRSLISFPLTPGEQIRLGEAVVTLVAGWGEWTDPGLSESERRNAISIVARLDFYDASILFTGDAVGRRRGDPPEACTDSELVMAENHDAGLVAIDADVLIAPHHGGDNASATCFIERVDPEFVVFSAGHQYDHPTGAAAGRYLTHGLLLDHIFRTDRGDDEGGGEWSNGRIPGCRDDRGDDDVEIVLPRVGPPRVAYRRQSTGC